MKLAVLSILAGTAAIVAVQARAQSPARTCQLMWREGEVRQRSPLPGFDPMAPRPLVLPKVDGQPAMIQCNGGTGLPEPKDYRVPAELRLPLAYGDGENAVFLALDDGQLKLLYPETMTAPFDQQKAQAIVDQMQDAMQGPAAPR